MTAEKVMILLFPMMSSKRQNNISLSLVWYKTLEGRNFQRDHTECRSHKHAWVKINIGVDKRGNQFCIPCKTEWQRRSRAAQKNRVSNLLPITN
jgi:hypothetical protein